MSSRTELLAAAKTLIWERGVAATSPNALLAAAGVGQGSLYHHFPTKDAWALAAIEALAADLDDETAALLDDSAPGLTRLQSYVDKPRIAQAGCRLGRLAFDPYLTAEPALAQPIADFFARTRDRLAAAAEAAVADGDLRAGIDPHDLAVTLLAVVQGGYVLARGTGDDDGMAAAVRGMGALLDAARPTPTRRNRR